MTEIDRNLQLLVAAYERLQFLEQENEHLRQKYDNASRVIAQMARTIDDLTEGNSTHSHQQTPQQPNHKYQLHTGITTASHIKWADRSGLLKNQQTTTSKFIPSNKSVIHTLITEMEDTLKKQESKMSSIEKKGVSGNKENRYGFKKQFKIYTDALQKVEQRQSAEHQRRKMTPVRESRVGNRIGVQYRDRLVL